MLESFYVKSKKLKTFVSKLDLKFKSLVCFCERMSENEISFEKLQRLLSEVLHGNAVWVGYAVLMVVSFTFIYLDYEIKKDYLSTNCSLFILYNGVLNYKAVTHITFS